jgi:hypothetical protein
MKLEDLRQNDLRNLIELQKQEIFEMRHEA